MVARDGDGKLEYANCGGVVGIMVKRVLRWLLRMAGLTIATLTAGIVIGVFDFGGELRRTLLRFPRHTLESTGFLILVCAVHIVVFYVCLGFIRELANRLKERHPQADTPLGHTLYLGRDMQLLAMATVYLLGLLGFDLYLLLLSSRPLVDQAGLFMFALLANSVAATLVFVFRRAFLLWIAALIIGVFVMKVSHLLA